MGLEAACAATIDGETTRGKALLETTELPLSSHIGHVGRRPRARAA